MRGSPLALALVLLLAGCVAPSLQTASVGAGGELRVVDAQGAPIPFAAFTLLAGEVPVLRGAASAAGVLTLPSLAFDRAILAATGFGSRALDAADLQGDVVLAPASALDPLDAQPVLRMLPPHTFDAYVLGPEALCGVRNTCGLSEPVIEAGPGGVLYASSTCCIGGSPPVWVSRDGGATWKDLETPGVREAVGIEGDLAVDAGGNVYFTDILVGAMWITAWDAEGSWLHTTPVPFRPLVDRPWVRAGEEGVVYFLYNTGSATDFHVSTDAGRTWSVAPVQTFPVGLGTLAQGPEPDHLWVVAGMVLYESTDGGETWSEGEEVPLPDGAAKDAGNYGFAVPAVDAAGRVLVAYDLGSEKESYDIHAAVREPDGTWTVRTVTDGLGTHVMPWPEAGPDGGFVVAWYGVDDEAKTPGTLAGDAAWYAHLASTHDAGATWQLARADPAPVLTGPMTRQLLDFLQVDLDEAGAAHVVYAHNRDGTNAELTSYARTTIGLGLPQLPLAGAAGEGGLLAPLVRIP